ncbi:putative membrane protein [Bacillus cereus]|nr:putative membrane protein [Bacillus cereus]
MSIITLALLLLAEILVPLFSSVLALKFVVTDGKSRME